MDNEKDMFTYLEDEDLEFTKEDRSKTLHKIRMNQLKRENPRKSTMRFAYPILGTLMVVLLAIVLLPTLFTGDDFNRGNSDQPQATKSEGMTFSLLLMGQDGTSNRTSIQVLLTYNSVEQSIKLVPIPRDAYVEIIDSEGERVTEDKLTHALALNADPKTVVNTVSNLFTIPIDYYSLIPEEKLMEVVGMTRGDSKVTVRESELASYLKEALSFSELKDLINSQQTNIPNEVLEQFSLDNAISMEVVDLGEGINDKYIDDIYYVDINESILEETSKMLNEHLTIHEN
ncbi:LCP family protein [Oceanobacillus limi]|nr:LCP family protein [Oceanobacillus limi]